METKCVPRARVAAREKGAVVVQWLYSFPIPRDEKVLEICFTNSVNIHNCTERYT